MTLVLDLRMATGWSPRTVEPALGRLGATWLRRLKNSPATGAADVFKNSLKTARAGTFMTERRTSMVATLQRSTANLQADMLWLKLFSGGWGVQSSVLTLRGLSLTCLLLSRTTTLATFMPTAIESGATYSRALGLLVDTLVTD